MNISDLNRQVLFNQRKPGPCFFDTKDLRVSCSGSAVGLGNAHFGQGTGPIFLDDVTCTGNEDSITTCSFAGYGQSDCDHTEDASVICDAGTGF